MGLTPAVKEILRNCATMKHAPDGQSFKSYHLCRTFFLPITGTLTRLCLIEFVLCVMGESHHLLDLLDLARETSSEKRRLLLRQITDIFVETPETYSDVETEQFGAVMGRIARDVEMEIRKDLAETLAHLPNAPRGLVAQLANDEIQVASKLLTHSGAMSDDVLLAIAHTKGQDHLHAMAQRRLVSPAVTDAIVARADDNVLETLVKNTGAAFSRDAMETVVARSETNERLQAPVLQRTDLPPDLMNEMLFFVSSNLKEFILKRTAALDPAELDKLIATAERRAERRLRMAAAAPTPAEKYIEEKYSRRELNEQLLVSLLRTKKVPEFMAGFARLADIDPQTTRRVLADKSREGLAIACRAARFDRATFSTIVLLADPSIRRTPQETTSLLSLYDRIPMETAQRVMRFWKVRRQASREENESPVAAAAQ